MKKHTFMTAFAALLLTSQLNAAVFSPLFNPVRTAIATNITALTNASELSPEQERQLRFLRLAQRNINRAGVPSLFTDIQILGGVTTLLGRAFPEGEFNPALQSAILGYHSALLDFGLTLSSNISLLPPSTATATAINAINDALDTLATFDPLASLPAQTSTLNRAASRLRLAQLVTVRARTTSVRRERFNALVDGRSFQANAGAGMSANYNSTAQFLTLSGRDISGGSSGTRTITIYIDDVRPGTTTHSIGGPASGTYAVYGAASSTNLLSFTSISGNVTVTLDAGAGTVSGRFSFDAESTSVPSQDARVTSGDFFLRF